MIAIVGMSGRFPGASTPEELFDNVLACRDEAREPPPGRWALPPEVAYSPGEPRLDRVYSKRACFLGPFEADLTGLTVDRARLARLDPLFHLALDLVGRAWRSGRTERLDRRRVGVILGAIALPASRQDGENRQVTGLPARLAAEALGLGGVAMTLDAACATGLYAVKLACDELLAGRADAMIAGGLSRPDSLYTQMGFCQLRALSPSGRCSPFSATADGLVVGEGGGCFLLKRLDDAERDGDEVLAVIAGAGLSNDLEGGLLAPASEGQLRAMRAAYAAAGWRPSDVGLIECHGTGTPVGDAAEVRSLRELWRGEPGRAVIGSVKSNIGHLLTGAGAAALCKAIIALRRGILPPTANHEMPLPELAGSPFRVLARPEAWEGPRRAAVSAFGFGGINAHLLITVGRADGALRGLTPPARRDAPLRELTPPAHRDAPRSERLPPGKFRIPPREAEAMLPQQTSLLLAVEEALRGVTLSGTVGAFVGTGMGSATLAFSRRWQALARGEEPDGPPLTADRVLGALASIAASRLARAFHLGGPCFTLDSASPAEDARRLAEHALRQGEVDVAIVGTVDEQGATAELLRLEESPAGVAFVYPGSGNDFPGMGLEVARLVGREAEVFWNTPGLALRERLFAQVAVGCLVTDLLVRLGARPTAAIGYSLGESVALFALGAWRGRERMRQALERSTLFTSDLCGRCDAARRAWGVDHVDWATAIVEKSPREVEEALRGLDRAYLQIIHGPRECVVGGDRRQVESLGGRIVPTTTTMHCPVVQPVAREYREMHHHPVTPPAGVRFYSSGLGRAYDLTSDAVADAILLQASRTVDFPAVIEAAYRDGVRTFIEVGPGSSCTRLIGKILEGRPHQALAALPAGPDGLVGIRRVCAALGLALPQPDAGADNPVAAAAASALARGEGHAAYLRLHASLMQSAARQAEVLARIGGEALPIPPGPTPAAAEAGAPSTALTREQCLAFAVGQIGDVLGPAFAPIDAFPTRVRLPDEPLMLVDRIVAIEGEPLSLTSGRVVTEHDVLPGAWYLDGGRIPTCLAVEAGQADLFLSGYLGIDLRTRGLAVYRLLDAAVTFHRGLPGPGEVIRYDIHIDSFFRQGDTYLFRFRFEGTVNGEPLLTMRDGVAGFFSEAELAAGQGVVRTRLQQQPRPGKRPEGERFLPPMKKEAYTEAQVDALRRGDLAGCFGPAFAGLPLRAPMGLPGGRMRLVHRVTHLDPEGGRFGMGLIRAEADIHPDDWFLTCHFIDDQVMPGTLMFECCLHTLRVFLMRLGWVGERDEAACEPVPGVTSKLKCRGQVTARTRVVTYEVEVKERGYGPDAYAIVDALMYADGKPVVDIGDMSLRVTGLTRDKVEALWRNAPGADAPGSPGRGALFTREQILAYAVGKPSEAFGPQYAEFDGRFLARLPGPPFLFVDRIVRADVEPFVMKAGGVVTAEYDVPPQAWYFAEARAPVMPFCVLLEAALQVCGWTSAYIGSALTSKEPLHYRNLGGKARQLRDVTPDSGTLATTVKVTRVASSAGMIIQELDLLTRDPAGPVYEGSTTFGFFSPKALAQQVGLRDVQPAEVAGPWAPFPREAPMPGDMLRMLDEMAWHPGRALAEGRKRVRPEEWFFKAHFLDDPVWPGSLGLEALIQLLQAVAVERFGRCRQFQVNHAPHEWAYRGQVLPDHRDVTVQARVTHLDEAARTVTADGLLTVDGRTIYRMTGFTVRAVM
jgi:acyl transferase domain-containing protein/3-hydroxymyristoyl/3-hydroxydecanoyl-(acyl carrier protein) dehydratase